MTKSEGHQRALQKTDGQRTMTGTLIAVASLSTVLSICLIWSCTLLLRRLIY